MTISGLRDGTRLRIRGRPTREEVAAVAAALDRVLADQDAPRAPDRPWQRAARLESVSGRIVRAPADLRSA